MSKNRPDFKSIKSFEEFNNYYWYREELTQICTSLGLESEGTKQELNHIIEQYFKGNRIEKSEKKRNKKQTIVITVHTPLLECGFSFNQTFRDYFSEVTGIHPFKFNADMAAAWRKVKKENDRSFTIQDMILVYHRKSKYATYDPAACQWNQFLKDFCRDEESQHYSNKLKVASILWKKVKESKNEKIYTRELLNQWADQVKKYGK